MQSKKKLVCIFSKAIMLLTLSVYIWCCPELVLSMYLKILFVFPSNHYGNFFILFLSATQQKTHNMGIRKTTQTPEHKIPNSNIDSDKSVCTSPVMLTPFKCWHVFSHHLMNKRTVTLQLYNKVNTCCT